MRLALLLSLLLPAAAWGQPHVVPLWEGGAPGFEGRRDEPEQAQDWWVRNVHNPSLTVFLPPDSVATGAAVVVAPGGGHRELVFDAEGRDAAAILNPLGVAVVVLKYRLFREEGSPYTLAHVEQDARRAVRLVRHRAAEWGVDPDRVGMLGFSAGGEVVAMVAYDDGAGDPEAADPVDRESSRPSFQALVYPGPLGVPEAVPADAPPAFIVVAQDDECCAPPALAILQRYHEAGVPVEGHIYARGGHAFNLGQRSDLRTLRTWPDRLADWLADNGWLTPSGERPPRGLE